jgi:hypothetical protein
MYFKFKIIYTLIFYISALLVLTNLNFYKKSKHIYSYFIVSTICSFFLDLNFVFHNVKTIYNAYDVFIIPGIIWSQYFQKTAKHTLLFIFIVIITLFLFDYFFTNKTIHPIFFSISLVFLIFHASKKTLQNMNVNVAIEYILLTIIQCFNLFFIISGYYNNIFLTFNKEYLLVYYLNASIQITFYIYLIYKQSIIKNVF